MARAPKSVLSKQEVGDRIRAVRKKRGISQVQLASMLGTNQSNISDIERGARGLTVKQIVRLSKALRVSTDEILLEEKTPREEGLLSDRRVLRRLQQIERLSKRDQQALFRTIDAFLLKVS